MVYSLYTMKHSRILLTALVVGLAGGCQFSDVVRITTKVYPNGSFDRRIAFDPVGSRETFQQAYILPSGLAWDVEEGTSPEEKNYVYAAAGHFYGLEFDYAKRDPDDPSRPSSRNHIEITMASDGFCRYQETFRDTVEKAKLLQGLERWYRTRIQTLVQHLATTLLVEERPDTVSRMAQGVTLGMLGWLDQLVALYGEISDESSQNSVLLWMDSEKKFLVTQIDRWWKEEGSFYPEEDAPIQVTSAVEDWEALETTEQLLSSLMGDLKLYDGVHGVWGMENTTAFEVSVEMPAEIMESNAHKVEGDRATWEFNPTYFWLKDYTLTAISPCTAEIPTP